MNEFVSQGQIDESPIINIVSEVFIIRGKDTVNAMMEIQHTGNSVEAKAVKMIFVEPEPAVRKKKVQYLVLSVIKAS